MTNSEKDGGREQHMTVPRSVFGLLAFGWIVASFVSTAVYGWPRQSFGAYLLLVLNGLAVLGLVEKYAFSPQ